MKKTKDARSAERPRVVMVDDDQDFLFVLRGWLSPDYDTVSLNNGAQLLDELPDLAPDLLILDVLMPGPDGFRVCLKLRSDPRWAALPILFLTGCQSEVDFLKGLNAGASSYLLKPVSRRELLARVKALLSPEPAEL